MNISIDLTKLKSIVLSRTFQINFLAVIYWAVHEYISSHPSDHNIGTIVAFANLLNVMLKELKNDPSIIQPIQGPTSNPTTNRPS